MQAILDDKHIYTFNPTMKPALSIKAPETVVFTTIDAFGGQITSEETNLEGFDPTRINAATGPVSVSRAEPGDTLVVHIQRIDLPNQGAIVTGKGLGVLGHGMANTAVKILPIEGDDVCFNDLRLAVAPMIGVIGVSPERETYPTRTAHRHGGNLDTKEIGEGSTVYLPVFQPGAMLAMGDVHAVMGDGEVCVSASEVSSQVTVHITVITGQQLTWPVVETEDGFYILVSLPSLDEAILNATTEAVTLLQRVLHLSFEEAYMLASLAVDIRISQLVNPNKTAKAFIPKTLVGEGAFQRARV